MGLLALFFTTFSAHAQGTISFRNVASTRFYIWTNNFEGTAPGLMSGTNAFRIGLYVSTDLGARESALHLAGLATNASPFPGRFLGPSPYSLPAGYPAGTPILFQLRVWSHHGGLSWDEGVFASRGGVVAGASPLGTVTPTAPPAPPAEIFGTRPGQLPSGFWIGPPIPEPSTYALTSLAMAALLLMRRSKGKSS